MRTKLLLFMAAAAVVGIGPASGARSAAQSSANIDAGLRLERGVAAQASAGRVLELLSHRDASLEVRAALTNTVDEHRRAELLRDPRTRGGHGQNRRPTCDGRRATIIGADGPDDLNGTTGRDVIVGLGGDDRIDGLGRDDLICAGGGDDLVYGGGGNDTLFGEEGDDLLDGGRDNDTIDGGGQRIDGAVFFDETGPVTASLATGTATGDGTDAFTNVSQLHGGDFSDTFTGDGGDNGLFGNGGDDRLVGGAGNDYLSGGTGDDTIDGEAGDFDAVTFWDATGSVAASLASGASSSGGEGNDTFTHVETLDGGPFADSLTGNDGDNGLFGMGGNDVLAGAGGNDFVDGGAGDDTMDGGGQPLDAAAFFDESGPVTASLVTGTATGDGADTLTNVRQLHGGGFADTFTGDGGDNGLFGNGGNDALYGGDGDDGLSGGAGDDSIDGGTGQFDNLDFFDASGPMNVDLAAGTYTGPGEGTDTFRNVDGISGGPFGDTLIGDGGNNFLAGRGANDTLSGGGGNDFVDGGAADDTMDGGAGEFDALAFFDATGPVTASLATGTATGDGSDTFVNVSQIHGGPYDDTFTGNAGDNTFFGNGGNDTIDGGLGTFDSVGYYGATGGVTGSLMTGTASGAGVGSDTFSGIEVLNGGQHADHLTGGPEQSGVTGGGGDDTLVGGSGGGFLVGDDGNDTITGGHANDYMVGGPGDDTMDGGGGQFDAVAFNSGPITASLATGTASGEGADSFTNAEQLDGGPFDDTLSGGPADGWIHGNGGDDTINGGSGNEFLIGEDGNDTINGGPGDDFLAPGGGLDALDGGPGFDNAAYWDSNGPVTASLAANTGSGDGLDLFANLEGIHGGGFDDTLFGDAGNNELFGNSGNDTLHGGGGDDSLNGGVGDDSLYGEAGNDYLDGAENVDLLDGGPDLDFCVNAETTMNCEAP